MNSSSKKIKTVGLVSLGCAKNRVDSEIMLGLLKKAGFEIVSEPEKADAIIINTCGFIDSAKEEAINTIIEMSRYKTTARCKRLIVTGCLSQRYPKQIIKQLPEVDAILGIGEYDKIVDAVMRRDFTDFVDDRQEIEYLNSDRILTTPKGSAYIKISEGCDNKCAYCAIPSIRGPLRSRKIEDIVSEAKGLALSGIKELVVVAQDTTRYGRDISADGKPMLGTLIRRLNEIEGIKWIRLLYLYPDEIYDDIFKAIHECEKVVHYLDLPLQHVDDDTLLRMNRRGNQKLIKNVIKRFRKEFPDCVIRTSFITGFPGETEEAHRKLLQFIKDEKLERVGIFEYSREEGTKAALMTPKIAKKIKQRRHDELMKAQMTVSSEYNRSRIGKIYDVLVEGVSDDGLFYTGRSKYEAPEEDGLIYFVAKDEIQIGEIVSVKILIAEDYDLTGEQV